MKPLHSLIAIIALSAAPLHAADTPTIRTALEAAESGKFDAAQYASLQSDPVWPWVEYAALNHDIQTLTIAQAQDFLQRRQDLPVADLFRSQWLTELARRKDWPNFLAAWQPRDNVALRCNQLQARRATGQADAQWNADAQAIWLISGKPLPDACNAVFDALAPTDTLRWQRIDLAIGEGQPGVIRNIARGLPASDAALANDYAAFLETPHFRALKWPKDARSKQAALAGLIRLAERSPDAAEAQAPQYADALGFDENERGKLAYALALWSAASYLPDTARRMEAVPESQFDDRLREWRVREAMTRGDWPAALTALRKMSPAQRADSHWQYFEARLAEKTGDAITAQRLDAAAANSATFHGYLAADRINQPYVLCPLQPVADVKAKDAVAADAGIVRAMELWQLQRTGWATREWDAALKHFNDTQRQLAVEVAGDNGWFDRAVFSLGNFGGQNRPDEMRLYALRFPLPHADTIQREAQRQALDAAWIAAHIRAESVFNPNARSAANARGLMQVLPSTGAAIAKRIGQPWRGSSTLFDADANIAIGTAYLRELLNKYGLPYLAVAAYNAGPVPVARWQSQRPDFDADFWIETIGYKETRDYVARIFVFSTIYDWRMGGQALSVSDRLQGHFDGKRKAFVCPATNTPQQ
jgi:soluble lytic murein transglycosylase